MLTSVSSRGRLPGTTLLTILAVSGCGGGNSPAPPTLQTTSFQVQEDQSLTASLGAQDPAGTALTITVDAAPVHGALTGPDSTGAFTYQPNKDFSGADSFHVDVVDANGKRTSASISITVQHVAEPPVATADSARTAPGVPVTINVLANDTDPKGHPLTPRITAQSPSGTAVVNSDGTVTFTPAAGFAGTTTVVYQDVNTEGDTSAGTNIQIQVRPLQKVIYMTIAQTIFLDDTNTVTAITNPAGAGSPLGMSLSKNGRTLLYGTTGQTDGTAWYSADLQGTLTGQYVASTGSFIGTGPVVLSDDGTMALYPVNGTAGNYESTELFLESLYGSLGGQVNAGTFSTEQVNDYYFGNQDQNIYYISHSPTNGSSHSLIYGATIANLGSAVQLSPSTADGDTIEPPLRMTSSGSQIVYEATRGSTLGLYVLNSASPGTEVLLGPTSPSLAGGLSLTSFDIASQGHYGAYVIQWTVSGSTGPAYAYLVSLDNPGSYSAIGAAFPDGTRLSAPLFSPAGNSVLLSISSGTGVALYEADVTQPSTLVQMSPTYPATSSITHFQYTPDGLNIVYTVDAQSTGIYDLFTIVRSKPAVATQLNQELGTSLYSSFFSISADSTTIAYAQPETSGGTLSLFLVDRTTPGLPFKTAADITPVQSEPQPFYVVPSR